jgi:hypothetical protein
MTVPSGSRRLAWRIVSYTFEGIAVPDASLKQTEWKGMSASRMSRRLCM